MHENERNAIVERLMESARRGEVRQFNRLEAQVYDELVASNELVRGEDGVYRIPSPAPFIGKDFTASSAAPSPPRGNEEDGYRNPLGASPKRRGLSNNKRRGITDDSPASVPPPAPFRGGDEEHSIE